jgi:SsrA-binding protein
MSKQIGPSKGTLLNKKAYHDYHVEQTFEAGLVLQGWEVKALRAGRAQIRDSYITLIRGEAWLSGAHFSPLSTTSAHIEADPTRLRKLLLSKKEISKLFGAVQRQGYTIVPLSLYWSRQRAKLKIGIAKGKKTFDKREALKQRDWSREKEKLFKRGS